MSKKRFRPLGDIIRMGFVEEGALLRYVYKDQLMAVGRARQTGIEVPGLGIVSAGKFEEHAGSKLHRPNQHTLAPSGKSLQDIMADSFEDGTDSDFHQSAAKPTLTVPLLDDPNDDFCRICGYGGDMLCCETCPATFHMECVGLKALPEGDWWCLQCVCAVCGQAQFEPKPLPAAAKKVIWVDAEDTVSGIGLAAPTRPLLQPPNPPPPATLPPTTVATPASTSGAAVNMETELPAEVMTDAHTAATLAAPNGTLPSNTAVTGHNQASSSQQLDSVPSTDLQPSVKAEEPTALPVPASTVGNAASAIGSDKSTEGTGLELTGNLSGTLPDALPDASHTPELQTAEQQVDTSSLTQRQTPLDGGVCVTGLSVPATVSNTDSLHQAAVSVHEGKRNSGRSTAQAGLPSLEGSLVQVHQGKKRKGLETAGLPADDAGGLLNDVPGIPGKKSKGKASEATAAVGGSNAGVDPSDNSSMHEQLRKVAANAASPLLVQEALATAFPPSQGSAKRAEKFRQFFSDVMPVSADFKERSFALAALASHLWEGSRGQALPSSHKAGAADKATPSSPRPVGRATPSSPTALLGMARGVGRSPQPALQASNHLGSPKEQLQSIATTAANITADIDAAAVAAAKLSKQQASRTGLPGFADLSSAMSPQAVDSSGVRLPNLVDSSSLQAPVDAPVLSEREARMAARAGRLHRKAASGSLEGKAAASKGKPSEVISSAEGQVIPQSDGPADDEAGDVIMTNDDVRAGMSNQAPALDQNSNLDSATAAAAAATADGTAGPRASKHATAGTVATTASTTAAAPAQVPAPPLGFSAVTTAGSPSVPHSQPSSSSFQPGESAPTAPRQLSALEQMAARYLHPSSSAQALHPEPPLLSGASLQTAAAPIPEPARQPNQDWVASLSGAKAPVFDSTPAQRLGLAPIHAAGQAATLDSKTLLSNSLKQQAKLAGADAASVSGVVGVLGGTQVVCPCSGRKHHSSCLFAQQQHQVVSEEDVWFSSPQHMQLSAELAGICCKGPLPCGQVDESTPVTWQLIRGAAVADPQSCRGHAPKYSASQKGHLRQVLFAARHILLDCCGRLDDSRTGEDVISWMLQGKCTKNRVLDFSAFHLAVLWVAGVMTSVALVRAFGPELAEVPLLATRHELQGNALGPLLLQQIEQTLLHAGVSCVIMPALPLPAGPSSEAPLPNQAAPLSTPAGVKPWGCLVGYNAPSPAQLLEACRTPMLQLPGTPYLVKQLSHDTLTKVRPLTGGLRLNRQADAEALAHSGILLPYLPETLDQPDSKPVPAANPGATPTPSSSEAAALLPPPEAPVHLTMHSTGTSNARPAVGFRPDTATVADGVYAGPAVVRPDMAPTVVDDEGHASQDVTTSGKPHTGTAADTESGGDGRQAWASSTAREVPAGDEMLVNRDSSGDRHGASKEPSGATLAGSMPAADVGTESRAAKRHKSAIVETDIAVAHTSASAVPNAAHSAAHAAGEEDDISRPQSIANAAVRSGQSPTLTTKDGSPSSAAPIRSVATPSRVKVPKQQSTMPLPCADL